MSYPESLQPSPARPAATASSLEYARPMPPVRERMVLPRSLAMTLMICGAVLILTPAWAIAWGALSHGYSNSDTQAFVFMVLTLTGLTGLVTLWFAVFLAPRVPRSGG